MARGAMWVRLTAILMLVFDAACADDVVIAGETPHMRPANAPTITSHQKDADWYCRALVGVEPPYSHSLRFLEDQGAWYSPFLVAGLTGRYDIRKRHGADTCRKR